MERVASNLKWFSRASVKVLPLKQGSPTPGTSLWPVRNRAAQQEVSGGRASKASSVAPYHSPLLALLPEPFPPTPSTEKLSSTKRVPGTKKVGDRCSQVSHSNIPSLSLLSSLPHFPLPPSLPSFLSEGPPCLLNGKIPKGIKILYMKIEVLCPVKLYVFTSQYLLSICCKINLS